MTEIISKRNKKPYFFLLIFSVSSVVASTYYMRVPMLCNIALPTLFLTFLLSIMCVFLLVNSHGAIELIDDTIVIRRGIRKTVINKNDILDVFPAPHPSKPDEIQKNVVSIKVLINGQEKTLICGDVTDVDYAVKKLIELIK